MYFFDFMGAGKPKWLQICQNIIHIFDDAICPPQIDLEIAPLNLEWIMRPLPATYWPTNQAIKYCTWYCSGVDFSLHQEGHSGPATCPPRQGANPILGMRPALLATKEVLMNIFFVGMKVVCVDDGN